MGLKRFWHVEAIYKDTWEFVLNIQTASGTYIAEICII